MRRFHYRFILYALCILLNFSGSTARAADLFTDLGLVTPKVRVEAPAFSLKNLNGAESRLTDFKGKVVLLNFWATWCDPCREEMPDMQQLWERYKKKDFIILAIAADKGDPKQVSSFVKKLTLTYPVLLDQDGEVRNTYEVVGLPMSYLIGRDGKISARSIGIIEWNNPEAFALLDDLLKQP